jgi:hypothetical protein
MTVSRLGKAAKLTLVASTAAGGAGAPGRDEHRFAAALLAREAGTGIASARLVDDQAEEFR